MYIQQLDHLNFSVANLDESLAWYGRVFGFELVERGVSSDVHYAIARSGDAMLCMYEHSELLPPRAGDNRHHRVAHIGFRITDEAQWCGLIEREGLEMDYPPTRYPHSSSWYVRDPSGYQIEVVRWDDDQIRFSTRRAA